MAATEIDLVPAVLIAITRGDLDDSFDEVYAALKARRDVLTLQQTAVLRVGQRVRFTGDWDGIEGVIEKKLAKNLKVRIDLSGYPGFCSRSEDSRWVVLGRRRIVEGSVWTVHPSLVEAVA